MCSIAGFYGLEDKILLKKISNIMSHRGPDDRGFFIDKNVGLANNRLSIIDVKGGHQPISNEDNSIHIVFNGEIYNYPNLKIKLEKSHRFKTNSDTETILHAYEEYGLNFVNKLQGMFAIAIWDQNKKRLLLVRDRLGIKPLYYTKINNIFLFASEIKAILQYEEIKKEIDFEAFRNYLLLTYIPAPRTIFRSIKKLQPGEILIYENNNINIKKFWEFKFFKNDKEDYVNKLHNLIQNSVKNRLISEVPFGAYLSGGLDSSTIVYFMNQFVDKPLKTFSVGFEGEEKYNELKFAKIIADKFNTDHHEFIVSTNFFDLLPRMVWHLDEPLADSAIVPTYLISKYAKKYVTVVLTGEGADEIFAGYDYYNTIVKRNKFLNPLAKNIAYKINEKNINKFPVFLRKYLNFLCVSGRLDKSYVNYNSVFYKGDLPFLLSKEILRKFDKVEPIENLFKVKNNRNMDLLSHSMYFDTKVALPEGLLMKVDKTTMANSIEARVPFLDHRIVEFSSKIPVKLKLNKNIDKYILKKTMSQKLPKTIINRKKHGFTSPKGAWLKEMNIKNRLLKYLEDSKIDQKSFFKGNYVKKIMDKAKLGYSQQIWSIFIFVLWHKIFMENENVSKYPKRLEL